MTLSGHGANPYVCQLSTTPTKLLATLSNARTVGAVVLLMLPALVAAQTIKLWPGAAPGSEHWTQKEVTYENTPVGTVTMNVVTPTITVYLPERAKATGAGVIIAPGGGFVALATTNGGTDVATWLQARGVAAFVLKYRTIEKKFEGIPPMDQDTAGRYGIADGIQAIKVVRKHAAEWGLAPGRIGMIGFSAGGMVVSGALLQRDAAARPNFAGLIYGAPFGVLPPIPAGLPPVFMAWAEDDGIARAFLPRFTDALRKSGQKPEAHIYKTGGHGFGITPRGTASDRWVADFDQWLRGIGVLSARRVGVETMPEALEVRFALSALPPAMRDAATAYRLDVTRGYMIAHRGRVVSRVSCRARVGKRPSSTMTNTFRAAAMPRAPAPICRCSWTPRRYA